MLSAPSPAPSAAQSKSTLAPKHLIVQPMRPLQQLNILLPKKHVPVVEHLGIASAHCAASYTARLFGS